MANQLASFNPVASFQAAESNALASQGSRLKLQQARKNAPRQNVLADIGVRQAQRGEQAGIRQSGISQENQRVQFLNKFGEAMSQIPTVEGRIQAAQILTPLAQKVGIDPAVFTPENLSNQGLQQLLTTTRGFINDPASFTTAQRDFESRAKNLSQADRDKASRISLGLDPRAVGSAAQTITDLGTAGDVAETEETIAGGKEAGKLDAQGRLLPDIDKQRALSKDAAALSTEIFTRIGNIEGNIRNMEEGISLIDQGANVGPVDKWLPSLKASTIKLDNLRNRLGLDVVASVTFGALSAGELKTAFDTALPPNLNDQELKKWFQDRITTQTKLLNSIEDAGIFLAEEGATIPKLMIKRRAERKATAQAPPAAPQTEDQTQEGQTATNPQTGETIIFRGGQWVGQ
ncbi:MAG: hypothetical protein V3U84_11505 [Thiotrichaceae bacterium]